MPAAVRSEEVKMCCMCSLLSRSQSRKMVVTIWGRENGSWEEGRDTHTSLR